MFWFLMSATAVGIGAAYVAQRLRATPRGGTKTEERARRAEATEFGGTTHRSRTARRLEGLSVRVR